MLVLTRKLGQKVEIGEGENAVTVVVVRIERDQVRLGFDADPRIPVRRIETDGGGNEYRVERKDKP